jgi:hypothetical protein
MLQLHQLPQDPFHPQFLPRLKQVVDMLGPRFVDSTSRAARQMLSLDPVSALHARLMRLQSGQGASGAAQGSWQSSQEASGATEGSLQSRQGASGATERTLQSSQRSPCAVGGSSQSTAEVSASALSVPTTSGSPAAAHSKIDTFCSLLAGILKAMAAVVDCLPLGNKKVAGEMDTLVLVTMEHLLSAPAALKVAVHLGLSAEVQHAAKEGSAAAVECMASVCTFFQNAAFALHIYSGATEAVDDSWRKVVSGQLPSFLQLEENLPFLEPLCLPPAHGDAQHLPGLPLGQRRACPPPAATTHEQPWLLR